ncbi:MAG: uroporphyrinogen decarboxylase family protein, partial [Candidatus Bathyarchaeota archaeon]|nr:uroporphyrinogen decarboxylase family protein [Candidatus Bathyarchaeota archaeon]
GGRMLVMGDIDGSFPVGGSWLHIFLKALYTDPYSVKKLINYTTRRAIAYIDAMVDSGVEAISGGADIAYRHGPYMNPKHFREFIMPSIKAHVDACHRRGVPFLKHTDGNINPIIDDFIVGTGIDGYLAIEPRAGMDIAKLKEAYGDRICFFGNIDCAYTLVYGFEDDVRREVRRLIDVAAHGGGLIVGSSNSVHSFVKPANFLAMIKEAKRYGIYHR